MSDGADRDGARRPGRTVVRQELRRLARQFADDLFATLDELGVFDVESKTEGKQTKRQRRSPRTLDDVSDKIMALMDHYGESLAISDIAAGLNLDKKHIVHPLALLVASEKLVQTGERRGVRYSLPPKKAAKPASKSSRKKKSKSVSRKAASSTKTKTSKKQR